MGARGRTGGLEKSNKKGKAPKVAIKPLEAVSIAQVEKLISTCSTKDFYDLRDNALFLFLLDTGARASEVCAVDLEDIDLRIGSVMIRCGKCRKHRIVFIGKKSKRALQAYLKPRAKDIKLEEDAALWVTLNHNRLTYWGLN